MINSLALVFYKDKKADRKIEYSEQTHSEIFSYIEH